MSQKKDKPDKIGYVDCQLNRYCALAGLASRRKSEELIRAGKILVNGVVRKDPGFRVSDSDYVRMGRRIIKPQPKMYILLNKPMGCLTTASDERGRPTVLDIVGAKTTIGLHPVGRLDMDTTGLLLITNDGDFTNKLAHPRNNVNKVYRVRLPRSFTLEHMEELRLGVYVDGQTEKVDKASFIDGKSDYIEVTLHSGRNRVIRRIFSRLGYKISSLDRVAYSFLRKGRLGPGEWRPLTAEEVKKLGG